jgi:chromate transporter
VPFPVIIVAAGLISVAAQRLRPELFAVKPATLAEGQQAPLIADDALHGETPSLARAMKILAIGLPLWAAPIAAAAVLLGRNHVFVDQGVFFSGTAVVTFGGAYAVLSYVAERAVNTFGWLMPGEMVNGLALAETTPGPLIMVVQFVAFLGAYRYPGDLNPWVAAIVGATLVVWVTFVPCFIFVLLGAPHIEALRRNVQLTAALTGITAAVVGVIANLSISFSLHTLFEQSRRHHWGRINVEFPVWSTLSLTALVVTALAFVLVFRRGVGVLRVLGICAVVGAALHVVT